MTRTYAAKVDGFGWPCMVPGCLKGGHGKPACADHVTSLPYPARIVAEVKRGAVNTIVATCGACGCSYDRQRSNARGSTCGPCRSSRDREAHRERQRQDRQRKRRAS